VASRFITYKAFKKWLDEHRREVRQWKPTAQRLNVHRGDLGHWIGGDDDGWAAPADAEQRKASLDAAKGRGK